MAAINSHEDLVAWQLSAELEDRVYEIVATPAAQRDGDFCDDIRRSGRSAPANLSEGFHRFRPRENARFVRIAIGSIGETMNHLRHALKHGYITDPAFGALMRLARRARGASTRRVEYLDSCPPDGPAPRDGRPDRRSRRRT